MPCSTLRFGPLIGADALIHAATSIAHCAALSVLAAAAAAGTAVVLQVANDNNL